MTSEGENKPGIDRPEGDRLAPSDAQATAFDAPVAAVRESGRAGAWGIPDRIGHYEIRRVIAFDGRRAPRAMLRTAGGTGRTRPR